MDDKQDEKDTPEANQPRECIADQIRRAGGNLTLTIDYVHTLANWSWTEDFPPPDGETLRQILTRLKRHVDEDDEEVRDLHEYWAAAYLELCRIGGSLEAPHVPKLFMWQGPNWMAPSWHVCASRWYKNRIRKFLIIFGPLDQPLDGKWEETQEQHEEWARHIDPVWQKVNPLLGFERTQALLLCKDFPTSSIGDDAKHESPILTSRPAYARDHLWLEMYEDSGAPTFHSPATIRDKWNALSDQERRAICPKQHKEIDAEDKGRGTVEAAIKKAKDEKSRAIDTDIAR